MIEESMQIIRNCFNEYIGAGTYMTIYLISIVYIFIKEKDKTYRAFTIWFPLIVSLIVFNPFFYKFLEKSGTLKADSYWRVFWMLPMGITIAYAFTKIVSEANEKNKKVMVFLSLVGVILIGRCYMFTNDDFKPYGNIYKLPDDIVMVTQIIGADESEYKKALTTQSIVPYVRQIDPSIKLAYGRSETGYGSDSLAMIVESGDAEKICEKAKDTESNYIVLQTENELHGDIEDYGYEVLDQTEFYTIYKEVEVEE